MEKENTEEMKRENEVLLLHNDTQNKQPKKKKKESKEDDEPHRLESKLGHDPAPCFWPGQEVDVLDTVKIWSEANIIAVDEKEQRVLVTYTYFSDRWDEWLPFTSERIAKRGSKTYRDESCKLSAGQRIEALDEQRNWLEAQVLGTCEEKGILVHYQNYHSKFDEWIPLHSKRIRPFGRMRKPHASKKSLIDRIQMKTKINNILDKKDTVSQTNKVVLLNSAQTKNKFRKRRILTPKNNQQETQLLEGHAFERYSNSLAKRSLILLKIQGDGNCLFRSISHQIYGNDSHHELVRGACIEYMRLEYAYFESFVACDFDSYLEEKARLGVWGDEPEIQALCELYDRPAQVWSYDAEKECATILRDYGDSLTMPMRLSYYGGGHYDSILTTNTKQRFAQLQPGELERRGIDKRRALEQRNDLSTAITISDTQATDNARLQAALEASRRQFDARDSDLESALKASLSSNSTDPQATAGAVQGAIQQAEESDVTAALRLSMHSAEDEAFSKGLQASFHDATQSEDAHLAAAIQSSVYEFGTAPEEDMDPELAAAIAASMEDQQ